MSKFHSTVSRRDFMKGLGLAGAGLGAAAAAAPVFHDLDEVASSPKAARHYPWWVKEREINNPTVEIDWDLLKNYDMRVAYAYQTQDLIDELVRDQVTLMKEGGLNKKPGMSLKDFAVLEALRKTQLFQNVYIPEPVQNYTTGSSTKPGGYTREELGIPKWEGTPEDNLRMCAAAIHFFGGRDIGALELGDQTSKKLFYTHNSYGARIKFDDVEHAYGDRDHVAVIPNKCRWMVVFTVPMSRLSYFNHVTTGKFGVYGAYSDGSILMVRVQAFLRTLGYEAVNHGLGFGSSLGSNTGFGVLAGNGELGRTDFVISPNYGGQVRETEFMITDLPLAPTKPIDAGIFRFCHTCKKCAEQCPSGAIDIADEPTWEPSGAWNGTGRKLYPINYPKCLPWRGAPGHTLAAGTGGCTNCCGVCVFSKLSEASIHDVVKATVATTSLFDGFFKTLDDSFGYGEPFVTPTGEINFNPEDWWNRDLQTYPFKGRVIGDGWE